MKQYEVFELELHGDRPEGSDVQIDLQAEFTLNGKRTKVKGFYAGEGTYIVRFYPTETGTCTYRVTGIVEAKGSEECVSSGAHGMVKAEGTHFVYENGEPYYPFGTTVYALAHQTEELIQETLETLKKEAFNKVRHCVFPKHYDYNHNEPQFYPFEKKEDGNWDVHHPCFAFWDHLEGVIMTLGKMDIETDLILFHSYDRWGFPFLSLEEWKVYLDYVLRRFSAIPHLWWSMANEYDFIFNHPLSDWYEVEAFIAENDPYRHLLSNHNGMRLYDFSRPAVTHCSIQTNAMHMADIWRERYQKPVIFDEFCYEGNVQHEWGNISGFEMVNRFWQACAKGAYATHGETFYSEDEVLWWAKGGTLKGESPKRIRFLKELVYSLPCALEPWNEPIFEDFSNPTEIVKEGEKPPFLQLLESLPEEERVNLAWKSASYSGHCGEEIYLKYFARQCAAVSSIRLPLEHTYKVEMIDVWEMTRETMYEDASGKTALTLPGREGIAVLAVKNP